MALVGIGGEGCPGHVHVRLLPGGWTCMVRPVPLRLGPVEVRGQDGVRVVPQDDAVVPGLPPVKVREHFGPDPEQDAIDLGGGSLLFLLLLFCSGRAVPVRPPAAARQPQSREARRGTEVPRAPVPEGAVDPGWPPLQRCCPRDRAAASTGGAGIVLPIPTPGPASQPGRVRAGVHDGPEPEHVAVPAFSPIGRGSRGGRRRRRIGH